MGSKKILIIAMTLLSALHTVQWFSYFQHTFYCTLENASLQIASTRFAWSRLCLELISQLKERKTEISSQLDWLNIQADTSYNSSVKTTLRRQRNDIEKLSSQILSGVNNLETRLYTNQKKKYFLQLRSIRIRLIAKQAVLSADLARSITDGQVTLVGKVISTIGFNYQRIKLIEWILSSKSLDEMMPLLDIYKGLIESQTTWK